MKITYDNLPQAVASLHEKLDTLERKLYHQQPESKSVNTTDIIYIDEALQFLSENGVPLTKSTLYKKVCLQELPHQKISKRLVFSRKDLSEWINAGMPKQSVLRAQQHAANQIKIA